MDKTHILDQIKKLAKENGGRAPGRTVFERETGISQKEWFGKYWARWGDAVQEAGLNPNQLNAAYDSDKVIGKFVELIRELGKFPVEGEIRLKSKQDSEFPSHNTIQSHLGPRSGRPARVIEFCEQRTGFDDVIEICRPLVVEPPADESEELTPDVTNQGYVYLLKSGKYYKIGRTNSPDRRQYEIGLQLPEKLNHIHSIETDDPSGIETYWHNRFRDKRLEGEWFSLTASDVRAFKRRKFM